MRNLLYGVKCVVFDFDETLCIWRHKYVYRHLETRRKCIEEGRMYYDTDDCGEPLFLKSTLMQAFIDEYCQNMRKCLMSCAETGDIRNQKMMWAMKTYGVQFLDYCVSSADYKVDILENITDDFNLLNKQILLVDDKVETLREVEREGYQTATPHDIAQFMFDVGNLSWNSYQKEGVQNG